MVVPGEVDWSVDDGAVDVSAGGELAEPAGEVDSCLEQADMSAMAPTHNNRTLRFIRSPHYCNGTVTLRPLSKRARQTRQSQEAFRQSRPGRRNPATHASCIPGRAPASGGAPWNCYSRRSHTWSAALDSRGNHGLGQMSPARDFEQ